MSSTERVCSYSVGSAALRLCGSVDEGAIAVDDVSQPFGRFHHDAPDAGGDVAAGQSTGPVSPSAIFEETHQVIEFSALLFQRMGGGGGFLHQRNVLLGHFIHLT